MIEGQPDWNPADYKRHAGFVSELGEPVVRWLAPRPGERILDLGCGDGALSARIADLGCELVAVDANPAFVAAARERGLDARLMDARELAFERPFDAVFSNAVLHWVPAAERVIDGVWRSLVPGGRFVGELGGGGNCRSVVEALRGAFERRGFVWREINPWYFPSTEGYAALLAQRGFQVEAIELIPRPTPLPGDITRWLETFASGLAAGFSADERTALFAEIRTRLLPGLRDQQGTWTLDYVRLRFRAIKPEVDRAASDPTTA
ncbi:MAG: methyltransferase domain-containing protein [Gammaproteobacteria bacterium]